MELKPGYKQTEVGVIPEDWNIESIQSLVEEKAPICYGVVQVGQYTEKGVPIVAIKFLKKINNAPLHLTSIQNERPYLRSRIKNGDILISIKGSIGYIGIVPEGFEGNISRELARLRINKDISSKYIAYQLEADRTQDRILKTVVGTTRLEFSIGALRQFLLPIPPTKSEQTAIATVLSDMDSYIESLAALIAKKRLIKQGAMQELLTGKRRLPGFQQKPGYKKTEVGVIPEDWEVDSIDNLAEIQTGDKNTQDQVEDGVFQFYVRSSIVERINSYSFDGEAVLTAGDGVGTGRIFHYINGRFDYHQRVYKISDFLRNLNGYYFYLYFGRYFYDRIKQMTAKSSVDSVRREMIAEMRIPLPSLPEQTAIATVLSDMDSEIETLESKLSKACDLKQGMIQELLTGRIRLV